MSDIVEMRELLSDDIISEEDAENPQQLFDNVDHRGFNLLLRAAENGTTEVVQGLLNIGFDVNSSFGPHTAASLAYQNQHFNTLLILLQANSKFPQNFNAQNIQHVGLIDFDRTMNEFHDHILSENTENLQNVINAHPNLRYYFKNDGKSATFEALNNAKFTSYELLVSNSTALSPNEDFDEAIKNLSDNQKEAIKQLHEKHSVAMPNNHLMIIHGSLFVGHDIPQAERLQRLNFAQNAIKFLDAIPHIQPMLKLIARAGGFKIIIDFNRDNIQFMSPKSSKDSRGLFCTTRHIYIAGKCLFDDVRKFEVYGSIAHEICHFSMDLVYNNQCKPYYKENKETIGREFHQILYQCRALVSIEEVIDFVWKYPDDKQFAELIVRVPHIVALYSDDQETLNDRRETFTKLFDFYINRVLPDIVNKIPTIGAEMNARREEFLDATFKRVSKWRKTAKAAIFLIPICIIFAAVLTFVNVFDPDLNYLELTADNQAKVKNGNVFFANNQLKFHEVFDIHDTKLLNNSFQPSQLKILIKGDTLNLTESPNVYLQDKIYLNYSNMTRKLMPRLMNSSLNFQGQNVKIYRLINDENSIILNTLTAYQMREILIGEKNHSIGKIQQANAKFYFERYFIYKNIDTSLASMDIDERNFTRSWSKKVMRNLKTFDQLTAGNKQKMILLSDSAGSGKTTTFKHMTVKLKENFPDYWVTFVDLKQHIEIYKKFIKNYTDNQSLNFLTKILNITDNFEVEIFNHLYASNKVIFFFDAVDEISPIYSRFFMKFTQSIRDSSHNQQWIATRPNIAEKILKKFKVKGYKLLPFDSCQKRKFIQNDLETLNYEGDIPAAISIIYKSAMRGGTVETPLMISMMVELCVFNETFVNTSNTYALYEKMIAMKKIMLDDKGEIISNKRDILNTEISIWVVHEIFALKLLYQDEFYNYFNDSFQSINEFSIIQYWLNEKSNWSPEYISCYGFLIVDNWNEKHEFPNFVHRSFAEFFVAKFVIRNLYELSENDENIKEIDLKVKLLISLVDKMLESELDFMVNFIEDQEQKSLNENLFEIITSPEMQRFFIQNILKDNTLKLLKIFSIDQRFLTKLTNENGTFFQNYFRLFVNFYTFTQLFEVYEKSLGSEWYTYTGYSMREKPLNDDKNEDLNDFVKQYKSISFDIISEEFCKSISRVLSFIEQIEIPRLELKSLLKRDIFALISFSMRSRRLIDRIMNIIENEFREHRDEFREIANHIYLTSHAEVDASNQFTDEYVSNIDYFAKKITNFFTPNNTQNDIDLRHLQVEIYITFYHIEKVPELFEKYNLCTREEIQYVFIKYPLRIISSFLDGIIVKTAKIFENTFRKVFIDHNNDGGSQLKKFLSNRQKATLNGKIHNFTAFEFLKDQMMYIELRATCKGYFKTLKKLAKEIGISELEISDMIHTSESEEINQDDYDEVQTTDYYYYDETTEVTTTVL